MLRPYVLMNQIKHIDSGTEEDDEGALYFKKSGIVDFFDITPQLNI